MTMNSLQHFSLKNLFDEYLPDSLRDEEYIYKLKETINSLSPTDKTLILLYTDLGSLRKVGQTLHVSEFTVYTNIKRIQKIIKDRLCSI